MTGDWSSGSALDVRKVERNMEWKGERERPSSQITCDKESCESTAVNHRTRSRSAAHEHISAAAGIFFFSVRRKCLKQWPQQCSFSLYVHVTEEPHLTAHLYVWSTDVCLIIYRIYHIYGTLLWWTLSPCCEGNVYVTCVYVTCQGHFVRSTTPKYAAFT